MKLRNLLLAASALAVVATAQAQQTDITITGATAFRQATMRAIYDAYLSVGAVGTTFNVAHDFAGNVSNQVREVLASNRAIFRGTFPGIAGETVIRTSFNGSTEGLNAIAGNNNPTFFQIQTLPAGITPLFQDNGGATETLRPKFSFSDVYQSTSPVQNEVLNPVGSSAVGVVTFAMVANEGAPANWTNVTQQNFSALLQQGILPLRIFTGDDADTRLVFATGRNDGSGTRSAYLTEIGYGVANAVNQYVATFTGVSTAGIITAITLVPQYGSAVLRDGNGVPILNNQGRVQEDTASVLRTSGGLSNASVLWGNDVVGNGGYSSGSALRGHMGRTSTSVTVYDGVSTTPLLENTNILLLTWLSTADARNAVSDGAKILAFNGVQVTPISTGFDDADKAKITNGLYSAWSYQHLYHHGTLSAAEQNWRNQMVSTWLNPALVSTANGIPLADMNSSRPDDGKPIVADF